MRRAPRPVLRVELLEGRDVPATFTVTTTDDSAEAVVVGSLRWAILEANATAAADTIAFALPGSGVVTVAPVAALPTITQPVTVDGWTQGGAGYEGPPLVELSGENLPGSNGLWIESAGSTVRGLVVNRFYNGIVLSGTGATDNRLLGNYIGTDAAGTGAFAPAGTAVLLTGGASGNLVGDGTDAGRNVITGYSHGVALGGTGNQVIGNFIGTDPTGSGVPGSVEGRLHGIRTEGDGPIKENQINANVIGGWEREAVLFFGVNVTNNLISLNSIGLGWDGSAVLGNRGAGIHIGIGASANEVTHNLISGNPGGGVSITDAYGVAAFGNTVASNIIGPNIHGDPVVDVDGMLIQFRGVGIANAYDNRIGLPGQGNVIAGNLYHGVEVALSEAVDNLVQGNRIGVLADGTLLSNGSSGVEVWGGATGTVIGTDGDGVEDEFEGNVIVANAGHGVVVYDAGTAGTVVAGNTIGGEGVGNGLSGVAVTAGATDTRVGTDGDGVSDDLERNVIGGNAEWGVVVDGDATAGTVLSGNYIGTDVDGTAAVPNGWDGVAVYGAPGTRIGVGGADLGFEAHEGNLISGNGQTGVLVYYAGASGAVVAGNRIGTDKDGLAPLPNAAQGVTVGDGAVDVRVGTDGDGANDDLEGNLISGNTYNGVELIDATARVVVAGNRIGTTADGAAAVPNGHYGVYVQDATDTRIGTDGDGANDDLEGNLISGNNLGGISLTGAVRTVVAGNRIGTVRDGLAPLPNGDFGLLIESGPDTRVGGVAAGEGNTIAYHGGAGVVVAWGGATQASIRGNRIFANAGLGIDLGGDGVTPNDPSDADAGPNGLQNFPEFAAKTGATTRVAGVLQSAPATTFHLDFYANPAGTDQGARYLGSATVTTNALGQATFDVTLTATTAAGEVVTATATSPTGGTSEFAAAVANPTAVTDFVVNNGQAQRSYVRYLEVIVDAPAAGLVAAGRVRLVKMDLNGNNPVPVALPAGAVTVDGNVLTVDFGAQGLGGNRNSVVGDGYYTLEFDFDWDGAFEAGRSFYRLLGDTNGNRTVNDADVAAIQSGIGGPYLFDLDVNGDGVVNATDRLLAVRSRGRALAAGLPLDG